MNTEEVSIVSLRAPADLTATGFSTSLDMQALDAEDAMIVLHAGAITSSVPSIAAKIQDSAGEVRAIDTLGAGTTSTILRNNTNDNVELAAKFTQSGNKTLKEVGLMLKANASITAGKLVTLTLCADSTGDPGSVLATANTVLCSAIPVAYGLVKFTFATPYELVDTTVYHLVLTGDYTLSTTVNVQWRSLTVGSGGNQQIKDTTWGAIVTTEKFEYYLSALAYADVAGLTFSALTAAGTVRRMALPSRAVRRHARLVLTLTGGTIIIGVMAIVAPRRRPVVAQL